VFKIRHYQDARGRNLFVDWFSGLRDRQARARIVARLERLELGNFGDCKGVGGGVVELRIDWGPGYRVYFGRDGQTVIVLLCGGDKRRQDADIEKAVELWQEYENREKRARRGKA
jgi:putative addiction module killer protein